MTRKRHSAEQIVAILRQIEVESADHKRIGLVYTSIHALNSKYPLPSLSLTTAVDTSILAALGRDNVVGRHYEEGSQEESFREKD
jgi:hypothetical protein